MRPYEKSAANRTSGALRFRSVPAVGYSARAGRRAGGRPPRPAFRAPSANSIRATTRASPARITTASQEEPSTPHTKGPSSNASSSTPWAPACRLGVGWPARCAGLRANSPCSGSYQHVRVTRLVCVCGVRNAKTKREYTPESAQHRTAHFLLLLRAKLGQATLGAETSSGPGVAGSAQRDAAHLRGLPAPRSFLFLALVTLSAMRSGRYLNAPGS